VNRGSDRPVIDIVYELLVKVLEEYAYRYEKNNNYIEFDLFPPRRVIIVVGIIRISFSAHLLPLTHRPGKR
jgi:hypothetical protein